MDLIAYLFTAIWNARWLLLLALVAWIIKACRNPIKRSVVYDSTEHDLEQQRKLRATIARTTEDFGINVRKGRQ
jgi:hypothetical protein